VRRGAAPAGRAPGTAPAEPTRCRGGSAWGDQIEHELVLAFQLQVLHPCARRQGKPQLQRLGCGGGQGEVTATIEEQALAAEGKQQGFACAQAFDAQASQGNGQKSLSWATGLLGRGLQNKAQGTGAQRTLQRLALWSDRHTPGQAAEAQAQNSAGIGPHLGPAQPRSPAPSAHQRDNQLGSWRRLTFSSSPPPSAERATRR
jgi:hypothetical protein